MWIDGGVAHLTDYWVEKRGDKWIVVETYHQHKFILGLDQPLCQTNTLDKLLIKEWRK